jgi:hypothetical protein
MTKAKKTKSLPKPNILRGVLYSLLVIPAGVAAWLLLWQYGFIASVVAWGIAWGAAWLYSWGSGREVTKEAAPYIIAVILISVILAFFSGMVSDIWGAYTTELGGKEGFFSEDFLATVWSNLIWWDYLSGYMMDLLISIVFAALGAGGIIYNLYTSDQTKKPSKKK